MCPSILEKTKAPIGESFFRSTYPRIHCTLLTNRFSKWWWSEQATRCTMLNYQASTGPNSPNQVELKMVLSCLTSALLLGSWLQTRTSHLSSIFVGWINCILRRLRGSLGEMHTDIGRIFFCQYTAALYSEPVMELQAPPKSFNTIYRPSMRWLSKPTIIRCSAHRLLML